MSLRLPSFADGSLRRLTACAFMSARDDVSLGDGDLCGHCEYDGADGAKLILAVRKSSSDADIHLHIDVVRKDKTPPPPDGWASYDRDALCKIVEDYFGHNDTCVAYDGVFDIDRCDLPRDGLLNSLLDVRTHSTGVDLELRGTTFAIRDDDFLQEFTWNLRSYSGEEEGKPVVSVTMSGYEHEKAIDADYLENGIDRLRRGVDRFVLEKKRPGLSKDAAKTSNADGTETPPSRAQA